jgi:ribosomal protein S18 acetylase RimI-like enzyme
MIIINFQANGWQFKYLQSNDLKWFLEIRNAVRRNLHDKREFTIIDAKKWYENGMMGNLYYVVVINQTKVGYTRIKKELETNKILVGLDLHPEYQGMGLAFPIFQGIWELVDELYKPDFIYLRVLKTNRIALNLYVKLGFQICNESEIDVEMFRKLY